MDMPVVPAARLKGYVGYAHAVQLGQHGKVGVSHKKLSKGIGDALFKNGTIFQFVHLNAAFLKFINQIIHLV